ncbi:MAG: hypothetical protein WBL49_11225 [Nitrososphaeraceae archaeon]
MHATKHFVNTGHPVIVALSDKAWKLCPSVREMITMRDLLLGCESGIELVAECYLSILEF